MYKYYMFIALFLSGCATTGEPGSASSERTADLDFRGNDCILIRTIRDYTPLDRQNLLIHGPGRRAYFVTLLSPAFEMRGAAGIRIESRDDQLCPFGGDGLIFGAFGGDSVPVRSISRLTEEQEELLLIRYGKIDPNESETPAQPESVKGAEVEELG